MTPAPTHNTLKLHPNRGRFVDGASSVHIDDYSTHWRTFACPVEGDATALAVVLGQLRGEFEASVEDGELHLDVSAARRPPDDRDASQTLDQLATVLRLEGLDVELA